MVLFIKSEWSLQTIRHRRGVLDLHFELYSLNWVLKLLISNCNLKGKAHLHPRHIKCTLCKRHAILPPSSSPLQFCVCIVLYILSGKSVLKYYCYDSYPHDGGILTLPCRSMCPLTTVANSHHQTLWTTTVKFVINTSMDRSLIRHIWSPRHTKRNLH